MAEYQPIPVDAAREVSERYGKSQVAIVAWDAAHGVVHTTTFGQSAEDKVQAARLGDLLTQAVAPGFTKTKTFEDFRDVPAARSKVLIERLERDVACLRFVVNFIASGHCVRPEYETRQTLDRLAAFHAVDRKADEATEDCERREP